MSQVIVVKQGPGRAVIAAGLRGTKGEAGAQGDTGLPFQVDAQGLLANRGAFDAEAVGFAYLATDTGELYFREGAAGGWSAGVAFQGPAGDSAYQVAVANGFVGTEVEWLAALQGDTGAAGRGITSLAINVSGHLIVTYTDAVESDLGLVVGADGRGIASMAINGSNHLIITYDDTTTEDAGLIPGTGGGSGDVVGPASAVDNGVALFDGITGELIKDGGVLGSGAFSAAYVHPNHTGDVTSTGDGAQVITDNAVTNAKLADVATATIKGRVTAATGDPEDLTATQVRTLLNVADGATANDTDASLKNRANHTGEQATSTITGLDAALAAKAAIAGLPSRIVTASGAITPSDAGLWIISTSATPITLTIGAEATAAWTTAGILPMVHILQIGAGAVTVTGDGFSVTLHAADTNVLDGAGAAATALWRATDTWSLIGRLVAA